MKKPCKICAILQGSLLVYENHPLSGWFQRGYAVEQRKTPCYNLSVSCKLKTRRKSWKILKIVYHIVSGIASII